MSMLMHRYTSLSQNDPSLMLSARRMRSNIIPTNEEIIAAGIPSQVQLETQILPDIRRNLSSGTGSITPVAGSPESNDGITFFTNAFSAMDDNSNLKKMVCELICDAKVWLAVLGNGIVQQIRRAFDSTYPRLLCYSDSNEPGLFSKMWKAIIDFIMPMLSKLGNIFAFGGKTKKDDDGNPVSVSQGFLTAQNLIMSATIIAVAVIAILIFAVII